MRYSTGSSQAVRGVLLSSKTLTLSFGLALPWLRYKGWPGSRLGTALLIAGGYLAFVFIGRVSTLTDTEPTRTS